MTRLTSVFAALAMAFVLAVPTAAQQFGQRSGFFLAAEGGMGLGSIDCGTICYSDAVIAPVGTIRIGGSPSDRVMIALELSYWRSVQDTTAQDYSYGMAVMKLYPLESIPAYIKAGAGVGRYGEERSSPGTAIWALNANGFVLQAGVGYEYSIASKIHVGPALTFVSARGHKASRNRLPTNDVSGTWLRLGLSVAWR